MKNKFHKKLLTGSQLLTGQAYKPLNNIHKRMQLLNNQFVNNIDKLQIFQLGLFVELWALCFRLALLVRLEIITKLYLLFVLLRTQNPHWESTKHLSEYFIHYI